MTLIGFARHELELIDTEPDVIDAYLKVLECFYEVTHTNGEPQLFISTIADLLYGTPLSPLTDDPDEWMEVAEKIWQSRRISEAFSFNGGKTYHLLSEKKNGKAPNHKSEKHKKKE